MEELIKLNNETNGRDKLVRLAQYTSRLVWHQLELHGADKYTVDRIRNLELSFSSCRKILRFGRCIDTFHSVFNTLHIEDWRLRGLVATSRIAHSLFLYADHIVWLSRSGLLRVDSDKWNRSANKFWLVSIVSNLARDLYELLIVFDIHRISILKAVQNDRLSDTLRQFAALVFLHKEVFVDTLKNSCDLFIPLTTLGLTRLSPSTIGVLGTMSSLAALVTIVKPIIKLT